MTSWEVAHTATLLVGTGLGVVVALGLVIVVAALAGHVGGRLLERMPFWQACAVAVLGIAMVMWLLVFLGTLFFGRVR